MPRKPVFSTNCKRCKRLHDFLKEVKSAHPDYFCKPVPPFGDPQAKCLIVGLAPGMHGANATGRPFTGDHAGILLYETLYEFGFSNQPVSESAADGLKLINSRITNAVKCLPPQNKPIGSEINTCNDFLAEELKGLPAGHVIIALGSIAHNATLKALGLKVKDCKFGHGTEYEIPGGILLSSYHCSRYNTQTKRLTSDMFKDIFKRAKQLIEQ